MEAWLRVRGWPARLLGTSEAWPCLGGRCWPESQRPWGRQKDEMKLFCRKTLRYGMQCILFTLFWFRRKGYVTLQQLVFEYIYWTTIYPPLFPMLAYSCNSWKVKFLTQIIIVWSYYMVFYIIKTEDIKYFSSESPRGRRMYLYQIFLWCILIILTKAFRNYPRKYIQQLGIAACTSIWKNPAYGRHWISRPMWIVAPIS